jgi:hypothetical protein
MEVNMQSQKKRQYSSYPESIAAHEKSEAATDEQKTQTQKQMGLWIDHRKAVIVTLTDEGHQVKLITSNLESDTRPAAGWPAHSGQDYRSNAEDHQERRLTGHLDKYYDEVISAVHDAQSILIFGPGEAKGELKKRIENKGLHGRIVAVETADEMTEPQIAAKVRQHFLK